MSKPHSPKRPRRSLGRNLLGPAADPIAEFLTDSDFAAGPPAPGAPTRRPPTAPAKQRDFDTGRLWTDFPEE